MKSKLEKIALRTSLIYWVISVLWIALSDRLLESMRIDVGTLSVLQTYKGWFFVSATASLLYLVLRNQLRRWELEAAERKRAEEALLESEQKYRSLFENSLDAIMLTEPQGGILEANREACRIFGRTEEELKAAGRAGVLDPDDPQSARALAERARTGGFRGELTLIRNDGSKFPAEVSSAILKDRHGNLRTSLIIRDIANEKMAVEKLRQSEEYLRALVENSSDVIAVLDKNFNSIYLSPSRKRIFGYEIDEANQGLQNVHPDDVSTTLSAFESIRSKPGATVTLEMRIRHKNGTWRSVEANVMNLLDNPAVHGIVVNYRDVTEKRRLQEQVIQSQKMESIGVLAAGIAHDFNNLLGVILGHSALIGRIDSGNDRINRGVKAIAQAAERGAALVRQMLTFARKNDVSFGLVSIGDSLGEFREFFHETFPKTMNLKCEINPAVPRVIADMTQINQILLNLSVNARDGMKGIGDLILSVDECDGVEVRGKFQSALADRYVTLRVSDTGAGMDEETRRHIFEPFFTTKEPGKGTGLGLSVVFGIMENHKGFIDVQSEVGKGSVFTLYFPVPAQAEKNECDSVEALTDVEGGSETVLIVEDEEMLRELALSILSSKGYRVITAADGDEAVEKYRGRSGEIDLVVSDYGLPKMSGDEVLRALKAINPEVRLIIATGYLDPPARSKLLEDGASEFILKPYKPAEILEKVRLVLDR